MDKDREDPTDALVSFASLLQQGNQNVCSMRISRRTRYGIRVTEPDTYVIDTLGGQGLSSISPGLKEGEDPTNGLVYSASLLQQGNQNVCSMRISRRARYGTRATEPDTYVIDTLGGQGTRVTEPDTYTLGMGAGDRDLLESLGSVGISPSELSAAARTRCDGECWPNARCEHGWTKTGRIPRML